MKRLAALACLLLAAGQAQAADPLTGVVDEVKVGVLKHDVDDLWSGFKRERGIDYNAELVFSPKLDLFGGSIRPNLGLSVNDSGYTSKAYAGAVWEWRHQGFFGGFGLGAAVHNGESEFVARDRKALGSPVLFRIPVEIGYEFTEHHRLSLMFDHVSNAFLADENEGLDTLGIRYGYRF